MRIGNKTKSALLTGAALLLAAANVWASASAVPGVDAPLNGLISVGANGYGVGMGIIAIIGGLVTLGTGHSHKVALGEMGAGGICAGGSHAAPAISGAWGGGAAALITLPHHPAVHLLAHPIAMIAGRFVG